MASFLALVIAPSRSSFKDAINKYQLNKPDTSDKNDYVEFKRWLDSLDISEKSGSASQHFISQCDNREEENEEQKSVCGIVTSVSDEGGLIDDYIYFRIDEVSAFDDEDIVKVGDRINADVVKRKGGWTAVRAVKIIERNLAKVWDESSVLDCESSVARILKIEDEMCTVEHGANFFVNSVKCGYILSVGDLIKMNVSEQGEIVEVEPLRIKDMTGRVTHPPRYDKSGNELCRGVINKDIQFSLDVCKDGYRPWREDEVQLTAIESKQGWCSWRAVAVKLVSKSKTKTNELRNLKSKDWALRGGYPFNQDQRKSLPSFLPKYPIPENVRDCILKGNDVLCLLPSLKNVLRLENYAARFDALIYLDEIYADVEIRKHGIKNCTLERKGEYLCLHVPGISDGKPSLSIGDIVVLLEPAHISSSIEYHGFIHHVAVEKEELLLKFHATFQDNFETSERYDVEFKYSRAPFRRCHFSVRLAQKRNCSNMLFPVKVRTSRKQCDVMLGMSKSMIHQMPKTITKPHTGQKFCFNTSLNVRQQQAVQRILHGEGRQHPYILFGPPGTGKTVTLVEVVLQLFHLLKWSRICVCAPSNSAVDVICERLAASGLVQESDMVRFNAFRRIESSIPDAIAKFCHHDEPVEKTSRYRIILTTCVNSGIFYNLQLPQDHFSHVCIDEAGQATEPETLIPIGLQTNGQVIMAGDPEQLGPVIMSPLANMYELNLSLLGRLMKLPLYSRHDETYENGYNPLLVTKLINNYRSHKDLLELPSKMFYAGELQPCATNMEYDFLLKWEHLPKAGFPILFHGIIGQQLRESNCPSLMNPAEIVQAIRYIKLLHGKEKVALHDIGVITPYRKQVEKMRIMLKATGLEGIKVGSVEEFQGQEKSVIVISTVRSGSIENRSENNISIRGALGFLSNYRRFNVGTTRAKILMIVLGNPFVLSFDPHWKSLLRYCVESGGYIGSCPFLSVFYISIRKTTSAINCSSPNQVLTTTRTAMITNNPT